MLGRTMLVVSAIVLGTVAAASGVSAAVYADSADQHERTPIGEQPGWAELRAGYGLYAEPEYVAKLSVADNPESVADFPFPVTSSEAKIIGRNADQIADAGKWMESGADPALADVRIAGAESPGGRPSWIVTSANPRDTADALAHAQWARDADIKIDRALHSRIELESVARKLVDESPRKSVRIDVEQGQVFVGVGANDPMRGSRWNVDGVEVATEVAPKGEYLADKHQHVWNLGTSPGAVWNANCVASGCGNGLDDCHTNIVTVGSGYYWQMTAQHCLDSNYTLYPTSKNGYLPGYQTVLQSNGLQAFNRSDGSDGAFFRIPQGHVTNKIHMKQGIYRTNIGTMTPISGATYCFSGQDTQTATYGLACGTSTYFGNYASNSGEAHYGWKIVLSSRTIQSGDSGTPVFQQLANGEARTVGIASYGSGNVFYFAVATIPMQAYGMSSY